MPKRPLYIGAALLIVVAIVALALTRGGGSEVAATTTQPVPPPTTSTTTTIATTTTTTIATLAFAGDGTVSEIDALVESLYRSIDEQGSPPPLPDGLAQHLSAAATPPLQIRTTTITADLKEGRRVAVVRAGEDSILMADETTGWKIVGADLPSVGLEPWFGPALRTILIVGSDARWNEVVDRSRSDSLHIITATADGAGSIVGIPRDSWVTTPSGGNGKITDILANHGIDGTFETVMAVSDTEIEGWILTGFLGFDIMAEAFGPFEIDLPQRIPRSSGFPGFSSGPQVVEPADQLLLLARIRKTLPKGDFDRSFNHGVIMQGALREVQRRGFEGLPELMRILDDTAHSSFTVGELLNLGATALSLDPDKVINVVIPGSVGSTSGGASIVRIGSEADAVFADQADDGLLNDSAG